MGINSNKDNKTNGAIGKDINGVDISQFVFNDDGTVSGIIPTDGTTGDNPDNKTITTYDKPKPITTRGGGLLIGGTSLGLGDISRPDDKPFNEDDNSRLNIGYRSGGGTTTSPISEERCNALNLTWDPETERCYWSEPCIVDPEFKIVLGSQGNEGVLFQVNDNEICQLQVKFEYLIQFDCETLRSCTESEASELGCLDSFNNLDIAVTIDKVVYRETPATSGLQTTYETTQTLENVHTSDLFKIDDIVDFFRGNCKTGLYVTGSTMCMSQLEQCIINTLSGNCDVFSACTLNSDWLTYEFEINDFETLSGITNEEIKLGFLVRNHDCDFNILVDRIEINKSCSEVDKNEIYITRCPSFELERVIDNKKSWVTSDEQDHRDYGIKGRETDYKIDNSRLAINTKEIDLEASPAKAIETDVWCYLRDNPSMFDCSTGQTQTTSCGDLGVNINNQLISDIDEMSTVNDFHNIIRTELIDVKSRKTISGYPLLKVIYDRYRNSFQGSTTSSAYEYLAMNKFVKLVGDYWVDLIEQVIPSTALWGSTHKYSNTIFDTQKFKYKKYTLKTCNSPSNIMFPSPTESFLTGDVEVSITDIINPEYTGPNCLTPTGLTTTCDYLYIEQINDGSEFIGSVTIVGESSTGDTVVIPECDLVINNIASSRKGGEIIFTPDIVGGTAPYSYSWSDGITTTGFYGWVGLPDTVNNENYIVIGDTSGLNDGDEYNVWLTVEDSEGCRYSLRGNHVYMMRG